MLTADQIVEQALGRVNEVTSTYPSARGPMYRRVGFRQRQLFGVAARLNPERFGVSAVAALLTDPSGRRIVDLSDIDGTTVPTPETVQLVEIADKGTSSFANGDVVTIVSADDPAAELAPRAFLRDKIIIGVGTDLDLVESLRVYYPRLSELFGLADKAKEVELEAPWDTLLELDLAIWILTKATQVSKEIRDAGITMFQAEEKSLVGDWLDHVAQYTPSVSRFVAPRVLAQE